MCFFIQITLKGTEVRPVFLSTSESWRSRGEGTRRGERERTREESKSTLQLQIKVTEDGTRWRKKQRNFVRIPWGTGVQGNVGPKEVRSYTNIYVKYLLQSV